MNPVALSAQASVPIPDGLNLDAWIVPPPADAAPETRGDVDENGVRKVKKSKKGKGKEVNGNKLKAGKKKQKEEEKNIHTEALIPIETEETPEEQAERERASRPSLFRDYNNPHSC